MPPSLKTKSCEIIVVPLNADKRAYSIALCVNPKLGSVMDVSSVFASLTRREPFHGGSTPASLLATVHRSEHQTHVLRLSGPAMGQTPFCGGRDCNL